MCIRDRGLQVVELPAASMLDLFGIRGFLGTVESEDAASLRAVAKVPKGARIVVAKSPGTGAAREVEWLFAPPLSVRTSVVEQQLGKLELSPAPGEPKAVLGLATPTTVDGARWPVRVRVRFEGTAGGPITRIAVYRDDAPAAPASASSGLLPVCPSLFQDARQMAIGESRACVCTRTGGIGVRGNGRYDASSSLCEAALHAGVIARAGDAVTFWRQPDCPRLWGSAANGVVSGNSASSTATFSFTAEPPPCPPPASTAADLKPCPGLFSQELEAMPEGSSFDCTCAYDKYGKGSLWGTRVYYIGSNVCDAAQHAGIVERKGSTVTVFLGGACDRFRGSRSYGKVSDSRRKPGRSMAFQQPFPACPGPTDP
ncbi:MAG: LCCL domain-containing protein, partial [Candidatus Eisenbacteria bacterium]|nr:LCCL domain-containing protein [Candidatus Eisenbacteria bacterium]